MTLVPLENCPISIPLYSEFSSVVTFEIVKTRLANVFQFVKRKIFKSENTIDTIEVSF